MDGTEGTQGFSILDLGDEMAWHDRLQLVAVKAVEKGMEIARLEGEIVTAAEGESAVE